MSLKLYNTLTRTKEDFVPIDPANVRLYVCGPTVYDYAHIGNARPVIVFDVLFRLLRHVYGEGHVTYVRNITDVDDKINARAVRDYPGVPPVEAIRTLTETTYGQFQADVAALACLPPTFTPRATEHVATMVALIEMLIARGYAYAAEGHALFHVPAMKTYGALARRSLDDMIAGARVDVAPYKRDPMDFVLWKPSSDDEPGWPSPWGRGRPGWHIECSAMSLDTLIAPFGGGFACDDPLRNTFDIHGGGIDLVFPHHENEIAQTCCALGTPRMANVWMHNGFLQVEGEKMSKSLGNFTTIRDLLERKELGANPGEVFRLTMLKTHYRQPIDWTEKGMMESRLELASWARAIADVTPDVEPPADIIAALEDDLNTHAALTVLRSLKNRSNSGSDPDSLGAARALGSGLRLLGFEKLVERATAGAAARDVGFRRSLELGYERARAKEAGLDPDLIETLVAARLAARKAKNFAESDRLRDELAAMGVTLKDGKDPATGEPVTTWEAKR